MKSSGTTSEPAIAPNDAALRLVVTSGFLVARFATVSDPRRRQGTRYPLAAVLALAVVAIMSNCTSVLAIAQFGADAPRALRQALGFPDGRTPQQSTLHRLFAKLNPDAVITVLAHACGQVVPAPNERASQGVAIDGKAQRGDLPPTRLRARSIASAPTATTSVSSSPKPPSSTLPTRPRPNSPLLPRSSRWSTGTIAP